MHTHASFAPHIKPTRIDIRHMRYIIAVADTGGFRAASKALNIVQPAISKGVKDAELDLGFLIFERNPRGIAPTNRGLQFIEDARQVVAQFQRAMRASRRNSEGTTGHVIVGYSALATSQQMSPGLETFHATHPGVQIEMHMMSTDTIMKSLRAGDIDIGFLLSHASVTDPDISQKPTWTTQIGIVTPQGPTSFTLDALRHYPFVMGLRENWRSYRSLLDAACQTAGFEPRIVDEAWDIQVIFQRVAAGRGVTFYPVSAAESLPASLTMVPVQDFDAELTISMAWSAASDTGLLRTFRQMFH